MPRVPRITEQGREDPIPLVRDTTRLSAADFGGTIAKAISGLGGDLRTIAGINAKEKKKADNTMLNGFQQNATERANDGIREFKEKTNGADPSQPDDYIRIYNEKENEKLELIKNTGNTDAYDEAVQMNRKNQMLYKNSILNRFAVKQDAWDKSVGLALVDSSAKNIYENRNSEVDIQAGFENISTGILRAFSEESPDEQDVRISNAQATVYTNLANLYIEDENWDSAQKLTDNAGFHNTVPEDIKGKIEQRIVDGRLKMNASVAAAQAYRAMDKAGDFGAKRIQEALLDGYKEFGKSPKVALPEFQNLLMAKIADREKVKREEIKADLMATKEVVLGIGTLSAALEQAGKALPENQERLRIMARSRYRDLDKTVSKVPQKQINIVMSSARDQIFQGNVTADEVETSYPRLPPKEWTKLKAFAKSVATDDADSKVFAFIKRALTTKAAGVAPSKFSVNKIFEYVQQMEFDHTPTAKEIEDTIDLLKLDGDVLADPSVGEQRRSGMSLQEAMDAGVAAQWIPTVSNVDQFEIASFADEHDLGLDPPGEIEHFDFDRTIARIAIHGLPALGTSFKRSAADRSVDLKRRADAIREQLVSFDVAREQLGAEMADFDVSGGKSGMLQSLKEAAKWDDMPEWMVTTLRTSGEYKRVVNYLKIDDDTGLTTQEKINRLGLSLLDAADDVK